MPGGQFSFYTSQFLASQLSQSGAASVVAGNRYTLGVSRAGASVRLYNAGVDVTVTVGVHINPLTSARSMKIGVADNLVANPYDGQTEFLRIFRGIALTASEHLAWHNALA